MVVSFISFLLCLALPAFAQTGVPPVPAGVPPPLVEELARSWATASTDAARERLTNRPEFLTPAISDALLDSGEARRRAGDFPEAMRRFQFALAIASNQHDDSRTAASLQLIGGLERLQGQYTDAEIHYRNALEYAKKTGDLARAAFILNNLGSLFAAQSRYREALEFLNGSLTLRTDAGIKPDPAAWQNMAGIYAYQGDRARSLEFFLEALALYEQMGEKGKIALVHFNLGVLQAQQANYTGAEQEFLRALALQKDVSDQIIIAQSLIELGGVYDQEGRSRQSLASLTQGMALSQRIGFKDGTGSSWLAIGDFHLRHHNSVRAAFSYTEAQRIFQSLHNSRSLGLTLRGIGYLARRDRKYDLASDYAGQALLEAQNAGDPENEWQAETLFALALRGKGNLEGSRQKLLRATSLIDAQRGKIAGGDVEKQRFFEKAAFPYFELASLDLERHQPLDALQSTERARARVLLDVLSTGPEPIDRLLSDAERAAELQLRAQVSGIAAQIARAKPENQKALKEEEARRWHDYESFRAALYISHPDLRTFRGESPVISPEEIAALLPNKSTALISYICDGDHTTLFVITSGPGGQPLVSTFKISLSRETLNRRVQHFRNTLEARDPGFRADARALYSLLVQPADALLQNKKRIYLVADGPLWELPFQTLITPSGHYWIEDATISYTPSLTFLRDSRLRRHPREMPPALDLLAFGNPLLAEQVTRIADLYPPGRTDLRTGTLATETAFKDQAPSARILHIATHGVVDPQNPLRSYILLAPNEASDSKSGGFKSGGNDGKLEAWEIMRLDLHADLAILSACETGRGRSAQGEGMLGLSWALLVAGVPSSVVSQWQVESVSTTSLMVGLHRQLRQKQPPAEALRNSILALMKNERYRHPFYWGAFITTGN